MDYCHAIMVSFNGHKNRQKVLDTILEHTDASMPLIHHPKTKLNSEHIIFVISEKLAKKILKHLRKIRHQNHCTFLSTRVYKKNIKDNLLRRINLREPNIMQDAMMIVNVIIRFLAEQWFNGTFPLQMTTA